MVQGHAKVGHRAIRVGCGKAGLRAVAPQHLHIGLEQQGIIHVLLGIKRALGVKIILCTAHQQRGGGRQILQA